MENNINNSSNEQLLCPPVGCSLISVLVRDPQFASVYTLCLSAVAQVRKVFNISWCLGSRIKFLHFWPHWLSPGPLPETQYPPSFTSLALSTYNTSTSPPLSPPFPPFSTSFPSSQVLTTFSGAGVCFILYARHFWLKQFFCCVSSSSPPSRCLCPTFVSLTINPLSYLEPLL